MSMFPGSQARHPTLDYGVESRATFSFFNTVYAWMCAGLAVTATVAYLVSLNAQLVALLHGRGVAVALLLGAWALSVGIGATAGRLSPMIATLLFLVYSSLIGVIISFIFLIYPMGSIFAAFLLTGGTFGVMSVYGFVTKRDLTTMGSYLIMAMIGLFIASLVNIFLANDAISWIITYAVLGVSMGLTAYKTQFLKEMARQTADDPTMAARYAIVGSLFLYISFINMFMSILRILGNRK